MDARMRRFRELCDQCELLPGVADLLDAARARGMPAAVASSSDRAWVEGWLARHRIRPLFGCVRTRDDVARVKPAPDLFLSAAACMGIAPQNCVVLEDSINGMLAATAAGMRCVAVPIALLGQSDLPPVTLRLASLDELPFDTLIERLEAAPVPQPAGVA
jgi:beta-phosphoglucomutase-like phosphatase (HAD superfamily)